MSSTPLPAVYLASRSPRRRELMTQLGISFRVLNVDISEVRHPNEAPRDFVERMAMEKARTAWASLGENERRPVLGADTMVQVNDHVLGKPQDIADARNQLAMLSNRTHEVLSAVAVVEETESVRVNISRVRFREISTWECERYCATGEPLDKAGSYGIQGLAAIFISHLEGSYSGVMGLPLMETAELLAGVGVDVFS